MKKLLTVPVLLLCFAIFSAESESSCDDSATTKVDKQQSEQQAVLLAEGAARTGMPAIQNFREKKILKDILELRDQDGLVTYTYIVAEMTGKLVPICDSIGYGVPYSTEYTNPAHAAYPDYHDSAVLPQADPNGLFSPSSADGTWVMCKNPNGKDVRPIYIEPHVIVSPFKLD